MKLNPFLKLMNTPTSRYFLRKLTNKKTKSGKNLLEEYLYCYFSGVVTDDMKSFMNYKTKMFNFGMNLIQNTILGENLVVKDGKKGAKLLFYGIKSIGEYGIKNPLVSVNPMSVIWNITNKCNLRCIHCYQDAGNNGTELTLEEKFDAMDQLSEAGCIFLTFSGGEPLLTDDIFDILKYAKEKDMIIRILTNGTLITKDVANKISRIGVDIVSVSLDGAKKETHDKIRGVRGSYEKAIEGVKNCVEENIKTAISPVLIKSNYKELEGMIELSKNLGVKYFLVNNFVPFGRGKEISHLNLPPNIKNEVIRKLARISFEEKDLLFVIEAPQFACSVKELAKELGNKNIITDIGILKDFEMNINFLNTGCYAGRLTLALNPNGDITPCILMDIVVGNTKRDKIKDIWNNSEVFKTLRSRENLKGNCGSCKDKYICGGCRASAYNYFKDLNAPDPTCIKNVEFWKD